MGRTSDKYENVVFSVLKEEKAIRQTDLIEKVATILREDKKKVKNALEYRLKSEKWNGKIYVYRYKEKNGLIKIKIIYLPGYKELAEKICSELTKKLTPYDIEKAISHFKEIKRNVLEPLLLYAPQVWWNGIFVSPRWFKFNITPIFALSFKDKKRLRPPTKIKKIEYNKYINNYPILVPFHEFQTPLDKDLFQDFIENHLNKKINPFLTFAQIKKLSKEYFDLKKKLFFQIEKVIKKFNFCNCETHYKECVLWRLMIYNVLIDLHSDKKERKYIYSDLDIIGNKILYIDVDNTLFYPIKSYLLLGEWLGKKPREIKKIKMLIQNNTTKDLENIIRRMDKILEIAEKVREKLMEEIRFYMDSKHLIGICDKM